MNHATLKKKSPSAQIIIFFQSSHVYSIYKSALEFQPLNFCLGLQGYSHLKVKANRRFMIIGGPTSGTTTDPRKDPVFPCDLGHKALQGTETGHIYLNG